MKDAKGNDHKRYLSQVFRSTQRAVDYFSTRSWGRLLTAQTKTAELT